MGSLEEHVSYYLNKLSTERFISPTITSVTIS